MNDKENNIKKTFIQSNSNINTVIKNNNSNEKIIKIDSKIEQHKNIFKGEKNKIKGTQFNNNEKGDKDKIAGEQGNTIFKVEKGEKKNTILNTIKGQTNKNNEEEYYLDFCKIKKKGVMGLKNIGNTCFMNSSLQCIIHIKQIYQKFKDVKLNALCSALKEIMYNTYDKPHPPKYFEPKEIFNIMSSHFPKYKTKRQQGANEFITHFLSILHDELNSTSHNEKSFNPLSDEILQKKFTKKQSFYHDNKSIIVDLFYGNSALLDKCEKGHIINALFSIFNILELSIYQDKKKKEIQLEDLIKSYSSKTDAKYSTKCPKCKSTKEVQIYNENKIIHTPDILIIYINKVIENYYYNNKIIFPSILDLTKEMDYEKEKNQKFNLIGIINHSGSENAGHYTANCKNFIDNIWYEYNDIFAYEIENIPKESEKVMILFYERIGL